MAGGNGVVREECILCFVDAWQGMNSIAEKSNRQKSIENLSFQDLKM